MPNIVVTQPLDLSADQITRLKNLGEVKIYNDLAKTPEAWLERCKGTDIICSGKFGLKSAMLYELEKVFFSLPFVGIGFFNKEKLRARNITVSYCPGCNKNAVAEWILGMMINLLRNLPDLINTRDLPPGEIPPPSMGLKDKHVLILGKGSIGSLVGKICEALDMRVKFFKRGDNLLEKLPAQDIIINVLRHEPSTDNLLNKEFFCSVQKGAYFITVTSTKILDIKAMLEALEEGVLTGVACDPGEMQVGDVKDPLYRKLISHPRILATPHIAYNTDVTGRMANDMMIDNIEAWLKRKPINLV